MTLPSLVRYLQKLPKQTRSVLLTCIYGLGAGISTVAFLLCTNAVYGAGLQELSRHSKTTFVVGSFAVIMASSLLVGYLLNSFCREAAGSGIPQLKLAFWKEFGTVSWRVAWVKFIAGVVSIGGGISLGREGPSVQMAGAVSSNLAGLAGEPKQHRRAAAAAGAAAGLAAAFNTPLAAITFVLEEIIGDLNSRFLGSVLLASILGAFVVHGVIGKQPAFTLVDTANPTLVGFILTPLVAVLASLVGVYFQKFSVGLLGRMKRQKKVPLWLLPAVGGLITWALGVSVFLSTDHLGVFGLGYGDLSSALQGNVVWKYAALLLVAKFVATFCCYGFAGCGGIFSPTLFFGGMVGVVVAGIAGMQWHIPQDDMVMLAVVGMSTCLGAVVRAPMTGILIVFEMTHNWSLVPALMFGALISQAISHRMTGKNFYEALLEQDGHEVEHVRPPRDLHSWQQLPVSAIANFKPVLIQDLAEGEVQNMLSAHPYKRFPVIIEKSFRGILTRTEAQEALQEKRPPQLAKPAVCLPHHTIRDLQFILMESPVAMAALLDRADGNILGLVTLHDLLRAQVSLSEQEEL